VTRALILGSRRKHPWLSEWDTTSIPSSDRYTPFPGATLRVTCELTRRLRRAAGRRSAQSCPQEPCQSVRA